MTVKQPTIIDAEPEPLPFDCAESALVVVDMQNDFCSPGGMFDRAGIDISPIQQTIGPTQKAVAAARDAGIRILYLKMGFRPDLSDLGARDSTNCIRHLQFGVGQACVTPEGHRGRFLIRDTWNTEVIEALRPKPEDFALYKPRFSGFYQTELDDILRRRQIRNLIFTGCTTSVCIDSTIRDAMFRDYRCLLLADCVGEPIGYGFPPSNHEASILTIKAVLGWVSDLSRFIAALRG